MKFRFPLLIVILLTACLPSSEGASQPAAQTSEVSKTSEVLTPTPAPTETPTPTPIPTYTIEQLKAMTPEQKLAAAPEIEGHTKWKVSERFVFYQTEDGKRDLAYDLTKAEQRQIKEFPICPIDNYPDCVIAREDLESGDYWLWLNTLSQPFDPAKIKDVPFVTRTFMDVTQKTEIIYDPTNAPNFADPATAPFHRDVATGIVYYMRDDGVRSYAIIRPIEYYDKDDPANTKWVIALESFYYHWRNITPETNKYFQWEIDTRKYWMRVTPILTTTFGSLGLEDPLVLGTFESYPDIHNRFEQFIAGDVSALSGPDIFVLTYTVRDTGNTYK